MTRIAAALLLAALPGPALAQAYHCAPPPRIAQPPEPRADGPTRRTAIAGYTLAASWSPEYCRGGDGASLQCSAANGRFGFVLHGLWPEARGGAWPQWCGNRPRPSPELLRRYLCMTPSPALLEHEWAKHGSCMARDPAGYYRVAAILWNSIRWPDADLLSRDPALTAGALRRAFVAANPGWRANQLGIVASDSGWLREVRLCYGADFMPETCPARRLGLADGARLKVWRGL